jgi:membrane-associated phospholipid phosphatase
VRYAGPLTDGFFYRLSTNAVHAGDSLGTAFPSSHVAGAVSMAILAARWLPRRLALVFGLEALGVVLSTVYTQNHFAIDSAVGVLLAVGVQLIAVPALEAVLQERRAELPVPPLPVYVMPQPDRARR